MKKRNFTRVITLMLVLIMTLALLFSFTASAVTPALLSSPEYIKQLGSVDTQYEKYLNSSVMFKLPDEVADDEIISIIIRLDEPTLMSTYKGSGYMSFQDYAFSPEAGTVRGNTDSVKDGILNELADEGVEFEVGTSYYSLLAGFELLVEAQYYEKLCASVKDKATVILCDEYQAAETKLVENKVNVDEATGIFNSKDFGYDGSGIVVAVLDTGLDYTHTAFSPSNFPNNGQKDKLGLNKDDVAAVLGDTNAAETIPGLIADDVYINDKVPFGFDYADKDSDVYSIHNNHGTHVSGVIVGNDDVIRGVAPNAQLVSMKVFSDTQDGAYTSWILAALEDCVTIGVDVINMSLGTACGFSTPMEKELVSTCYDDIRAAGISLVTAASNDYSSAQGSEKNGNLGLTSNPDTATVGSPSTYLGAMSVASISGTKTPYILYGETIMYFDEATDAASEEKNFFDELLPEGVDEKVFEFVLIPGIGSLPDYSGLDMTGKIALVRRGTSTFEEKANAAQKAGAAGLIIYNNTSGVIKMNAGTTSIPLCSISRDDGEILATAKTGTVKISRSQSSGPFMSDFSSWGPSPSLGIKPEITAHGGNILSAITGGEYDRLSGTSMASPNIAGLTAVLRQYVLENHPKANITDENGNIDYTKVSSVVNRLMMSTADIVINKTGLPYSVRKQGAGLANLINSSLTTALITTYDRVTGEALDKTKIELGDDPAKTGVYTLKFTLQNFGSTSLSYDISAMVMTEGVSDVPTYNNETTVTTDGYILEGATVSSVCDAGGVIDGNRLTVEAGKSATVTTTITLSEADKKYLDTSFENGMYVEGFIILTAKEGTEINLNSPFLAFYGDWAKAPLFDLLDYYDTNRDELDDSLQTLDKTLPDAYATRPIGGVEEDYISYMGGYYFIQDPKDKIVAAERDYIAISNYEGAVHSIRYVWAGLLRNAKRVDVTITDDATGEVVFSRTENDIRKTHSGGGSYMYPASIEIDFDAAKENLKNNTTYTVKLQGYLDYGNGGLETNENNTFEFPFTTDFEAPSLTDVRYYTEYDRSAKKTKLFAELAIYDNHYSMAMTVGYIGKAPENSEYENEFKSLEHYPTPIYSKDKDSTTYVTYELTDFIYDLKRNSLDHEFKNSNTFALALYDYALNISTYEVPLPDEFIDFYLEEESLTLSPNEVYDLMALVYPETEWPELLTYKSSNPDVVRVVNNKVVATGSGSAEIVVYNPKSLTGYESRIPVTVLKEGDEGYKKLSKPVLDKFELVGYETIKAFKVMSNEDKDIGETGDVRKLEGLRTLEMYPSESIKLQYILYAYFPDATTVEFKSGKDSIVTVTEDGVITAQAKGSASISVKVMMDGKTTSYSETLRIEVKDPYLRSGPWLTNYYGLGGVVVIPEDLSFTTINNFAFSNYEYIMKSPEEITEEDESLTKIWYIGNHEITKVVIPEGVETIGAYAFANCSKLEEVVLPSTLKYIDYGAFYNCHKLKKVSGIEYVKTINKQAFQNCSLTGTLNLDSIHAVADYAFAGNTKLQGVVLAETLSSIGAGAFLGDVSLETVGIKADKVKLGDQVFAKCTSLTTVTNLNSNVIPNDAFEGCSGLTEITIGKDVNAIGVGAFANTSIERFYVDSNNTTFGEANGSAYILSKDGKSILLVAPAVSGKFTLNDSNVTTIAQGAFAGNKLLTSVSIPSAVYVQSYAFADCIKLSSIELGALKAIDDHAFYNTDIGKLPAFSALTEKVIGDYAFAFTNVQSVTIPDGFTVGEGAFAECQSLTTVSVGNDVVIGTGAFMLSENTANPKNGKLNYSVIRDPKNGLYRVDYISRLAAVTIGVNAVIGDSAFYGAARVNYVSLGDGAKIGPKAFYNAAMLQRIDLSKVLSIGELAFSGNNKELFYDNNLKNAVPNAYKFFSPAFTTINLSSVTELGEAAFKFCRSLTKVTLGDELTEIPANAFVDCGELDEINLEKVEKIGKYAFAGCKLETVNMASATEIGEYAFLNNKELRSVSLNESGTDILKAAFAECAKLNEVKSLGKSQYVGDRAFTRTAVTSIDLSSAVYVGDGAFSKDGDEKVSITVIFGDKLTDIGNNPFAMCELAPLYKEVIKTFNGKDYVTQNYTYDISDSVKVIDGSIYRVVPYGLELITYTGLNSADLTIPEGTTRISDMALAGSEVGRVTLPHSLVSIGHKAFFGCDKLHTVIFQSFEAPNLEEEFDINYYGSFENFAATGDYSWMYTDGSVVTIPGLGIVPYYMYDVQAYYSSVFYGANFVDYIGKTEGDLVMIRPVNGKYYDTFVYGQYFGTVIDGYVAADKVTVNAINAINRMPGSVQLSDEALVIAAREAYNKIATKDQQALVSNYDLLVKAEARIAAFKAEQNPDTTPDVDTPVVEGGNDNTLLIILACVEGAIILAGACLVIILIKKKKNEGNR